MGRLREAVVALGELGAAVFEVLLLLLLAEEGNAVRRAAELGMELYGEG